MNNITYGVRTLLILLMIPILGFAGKEKTKAPQKLTPQEETVVQALFIEGVQAHILGNNLEALSRFGEVVKRDPNNDPALYEMARIYYENGSLDQAIDHARRAIRLNPNNEFYYVYLAEAQGEKGDYDEASQTYATLLKLRPREYDYYYDWAFMLSQARRPKEAIEVYNLLEQKTGVQEEIIFQKQLLWLQQEKVEEAVLDMEKLIALYPGEVRYYLICGEIYERAELYDKAIATYERVLQRDPDNPDALVGIAGVYRLQGKDQQYQDYLDQVFSNPNISVDSKVLTLIPLIEKIGTDTALGQSALQMADLILKAHPGDVKAIVTKADVLYTLERRQEALDEYMRAIGLTDTVPGTVWIQLYVLCAELEDFDNLITIATRGIKANPEDPFGYFYAAIAYQQQKQFAEAGAAIDGGLNLEKALLDQDLSFAPQLKLQMLITLGDVSFELKNYARSDSAYEAALEIDPNNATVLNNYAYYLSERNEQLDKAERMSKKSNLLVDGNSAFLDTYAWIMYQLKNYKEALKWIEEAMALPDAQGRAELLEHYGDILFQLGDEDKAMEKWQKALDAGGDAAVLGAKLKTKKIE